MKDYQIYLTIHLASSSSATKPVVRFAIPDLKLVTVIEESGAVEDANDVDDDTEHLSSNGTKERIQSKLVLPHKPGNHKRKRRQHINKRESCRGEENIRKEMVSWDKIQRILLTFFLLSLPRLDLFKRRKSQMKQPSSSLAFWTLIWRWWRKNSMRRSVNSS